MASRVRVFTNSNPGRVEFPNVVPSGETFSTPLLLSNRPESFRSAVSRTTVRPDKITCLSLVANSFNDPNAVKVVLAEDGHALYFSRSTIPFDRERTGGLVYRKHLGLYAYRREALERFAGLPPNPLETMERLEQLRLLAHNIPIYVEQTPHTTIGVDTEADLDRVAAILAAR